MSAQKDTKDTKNDTTKVEKNDHKDNQEKEQTLEQDQTNADASKWTPVWDSNVQAYYYWNTETNETTWVNPLDPNAAASTSAESNTTATASGAATENPLDFLLDRIDNEVKKKLDNGENETATSEQQPYYDNAYYGDQYYDYTDYSTQAHFNARTGRFTAQAEVERLNPEHLSFTARATRQMNAYFDVDSYTEQRNAERAAGKVTKKKPLTRKEIEYFKKMKQEKKNKRAREWLLQ